MFRSDIPKLRLLTKVPLAAGEEWGQRWDFNNTQMQTHISEGRDMRAGKLWPTGRPGLGVTLNMAQLTLVSTVTVGPSNTIYFRPDGSQTNW